MGKNSVHCLHGISKNRMPTATSVPFFPKTKQFFSLFFVVFVGYHGEKNQHWFLNSVKLLGHKFYPTLILPISTPTFGSLYTITITPCQNSHFWTQGMYHHKLNDYSAPCS
jgi:hypothetical protein